MNTQKASISANVKQYLIRYESYQDLSGCFYD